MSEVLRSRLMYPVVCSHSIGESGLDYFGPGNVCDSGREWNPGCRCGGASIALVEEPTYSMPDLDYQAQTKPLPGELPWPIVDAGGMCDFGVLVLDSGPVFNESGCCFRVDRLMCGLCGEGFGALRAPGRRG